MEKLYKKDHSAELDLEFQNAKIFGKIKVGTEHIFWKKIVRWYYIPVSELKQIYRRIEQVNSRTSCCEQDFSIHRLVLVFPDDRELVLMMGDSMYRREPELMMEEIAKRFPDLPQAMPEVRKKN